MTSGNMRTELWYCAASSASAPSSNSVILSGQWRRLSAYGGNTDFIPLGPQGAWDSHMVYASVAPILDTSSPSGERFLRIYYTGANGPHGSVKTYYLRRTCLGMGRVAVDRFAGLWSQIPSGDLRDTAVVIVTMRCPLSRSRSLTRR